MEEHSRNVKLSYEATFHHTDLISMLFYIYLYLVFLIYFLVTG